MKNTSNYPSSLDKLPEEDRTMFHLSAELDFDLSALIGKIKYVSTLCRSVEHFRFVKTILSDLHDIVDNYYDDFENDEHNE